MSSVTSYALSGDEAKTRPAGCDRYAAQPYSPRQLLEAILAVHRAQLLSYLRLGGSKLGYLLNFTVAHMRDGVVRDGQWSVILRDLCASFTSFALKRCF